MQLSLSMELLLDIASYFFWVILAITILVFVHELGHFLAAKLFGMRVDRFAVGFPPFVARRTVGQTEYALGATPLGGYVKIAGMIDESLDTEVSEEPAPDEYRAKPVWQRIVVITAGVIFNVILAALIFMGLKYAYGERYIPADSVDQIYVTQGSVADRIGLRTGDRVLAVGGQPLERFDELMGMGMILADSLTITVERDGRDVVLHGPDDIMTQMSRADREGQDFGVGFVPSVVGGVSEGSPADSVGLRAGDRVLAVEQQPVVFWRQMADRIGRSGGAPLTVRWFRADSLAGGETPAAAVVEQQARGRVYEAVVRPAVEGDRAVLGVYDIQYDPALMEAVLGIREQRYGLGGAAVAGLEETWTTTATIAVSLKRVFTGRDNFRENVGGPVAIARVTKQAAERGARFFWRIVAFLSITLAIMNILPIPALDGGHLVFLLYEAVTRREPSVRVRLALQQIGMAVLVLFMAFVIFNDILRW